MSTPADEPRYPRPAQVTVAGWSIVVAGTMLVPSIFDAMSRLRSVQTRTALQESLTTGPGRSLGLGLEEATELIRVVLMVSGAAAVAMAILGWFVLKGDRPARIAASVLVLPVMACAPFAGGFLAAIAAAGSAMLWTGPARDWFAGRKPREPRLPSGPGAGQRPGQRPGPRPDQQDERRHEHAGSGAGDERTADPAVRVTAPVTAAPPMPGYGAPHGPAPGQAWPAHQQAWPHEPAAPARPAQVQTACVLTWVFSGITAGFGLILLLALVADPARMVDLVVDTARDRGEPLERSLVQPGLWAGSIVLVLWSAGAALLAMFAWRRQPWARIALAVSAVLAAVLAVFAFPISLLHLAATAWVVGILLSPATREWFRG